MAGEHIGGRGRWSAWLEESRRYCVMEAWVKGIGLVGFVVVDLEARDVHSRHAAVQTARCAADGLVSAAAASLGGRRP